MKNDGKKISIFYHPSEKKTIWRRYLEQSDYSDREYKEYPGVFQCAQTTTPIIPPRNSYRLNIFAAIFLLPICIDKFCMMLDRKGDSLQAIIYGFVIPVSLFTILKRLMAASTSWEPIDQENVSLREASDWQRAYELKHRRTMLLCFFCISLPFSLLIFFVCR